MLGMALCGQIEADGQQLLRESVTAHTRLSGQCCPYPRSHAAPHMQQHMLHFCNAPQISHQDLNWLPVDF